jgi:Zn-dependent protease with chaperone function
VPNQTPAHLAPLVHRKERIYYGVMLAISLLIYAGLAAAMVASAESAGVILFYGVIVMLVAVMMKGMMIGHIRANGVRVKETQFSMLHRAVVRHTASLGMTSTPDVFIVQAGGLLNAFATRFLGRDFVVLYSDVVAMAETGGEAMVGFIVAHELAHVQRGHLRKRAYVLPARLVPYLGAAYSRACEYTCDRFAAYCQPDGAVDGLLALAAGPQLYRHVNVAEYAGQARTETGFWVRRAELVSSHPSLPKRISALIDAGTDVPAYSPIRSNRAAMMPG